MLVLAQTSSDGGAAALGFLLLLTIVAAMYFLPTIVAFLRSAPNKVSVLIVNLFLGWTFIGWVVALAMSFGDRTTTQVTVVNNQMQPGDQSGS